MSPALTLSGSMSLEKPSSAFATATWKRCVFPNGFHVARTLNQAKKHGRTTRPTMTMPVMTLV